MKKLAVFGAALAAAVLSFSSFGRTFEVATEAELKAALGEASETGGDEIIIAANTTIKLTAAITVEKPVTIRGAAEREYTILSANSKNYHVIEMKHPDAVLKNVTLTGSKVGYLVKGGLIMSGGLVTNVVITGNIGNDTDSGPLAYLTGGPSHGLAHHGERRRTSETDGCPAGWNPGQLSCRAGARSRSLPDCGQQDAVNDRSVLWRGTSGRWLCP